MFRAKLGIAQINGENKPLAIGRFIEPIVDFYELRGGLSALFQDLRRNGIPNEIEKDFWLLCKQLKSTITQMPMKYIGYSVYGKHYGIFNFQTSTKPKKSGKISSLLLTQAFGEFSLPADYFEVFEFMGGFISGSNSIVFKWADFSVNQIKDIKYEAIIEELTKSPTLERNVAESTKFYSNLIADQRFLECVWSGKRIIETTDKNIDHIIPYAVWHNNDLWNLLPTHKTINSKKSDKIPTRELITKRKDAIIFYWELLHSEFENAFANELEMSILGKKLSPNWQSQGIERLIATSDYLINERGFDPYNG